MSFLKKYKIIQPNFETLKLSWVYYASLIGYSILIATNTNYLNFFDEFNMANYFKDNIWHGIEPHQFKSGRFQILNGLDIYILSLVFGQKINIFYLFIAFQFFITFHFIKKTICLISPSVNYFILTFILMILIFSPSFTYIYFRLYYPERVLLMIHSIIIYTLIRSSFAKKINASKIILIFILALASLFYKESSFIIITLYGIVLLFFSNYIKAPTNKIKKIGIAFIAISVTYLILYFLLIYPNIENIYTKHNFGYLQNTVLSIFAWIINDPFIFIIIPFCIYYLKTENVESNLLSILIKFYFCQLSLLFLLLILKIHTVYYISPLYSTALPILYLICTEQFRDKNKYFKFVLSICIILQFSSCVIGVNDILFQKYSNKNINTSFKYVKDLITENKNFNFEIEIDGGSLYTSDFNGILEGYLKNELVSSENYNFPYIDKIYKTINVDKKLKTKKIIIITPWSIENKIDKSQYNCRYFLGDICLEKINIQYLIRYLMNTIIGKEIIDRNLIKKPSYIVLLSKK
jgi:hypothetical protein